MRNELINPKNPNMQILSLAEELSRKYPKIKDDNHMFLHGISGNMYYGLVLDKKKREEPKFIPLKDILTGKIKDEDNPAVIERFESGDTAKIEEFIKKYRE